MKGKLIRGINTDRGKPNILFNSMEMPVTPPSIKWLDDYGNGKLRIQCSPGFGSGNQFKGALLVLRSRQRVFDPHSFGLLPGLKAFAVYMRLETNMKFTLVNGFVLRPNFNGGITLCLMQFRQ